MILGTGCLGARALDGQAIVEALGDTGLSRVLLVAQDGAAPEGLLRIPAAAVRAAWKQRALGVSAARAARCPRLVLELPEDAELEAAARALHAFGVGEPGLMLAVATPPAGPLAEPSALELLLADLANQRTGYWHRPSSAARAGQPDHAWMDVLGRYLVGLSLDDLADGEAGLPPGLGTLDFAPLVEHAVSGLDVALDVAPVQDVGLLRFTVDQLGRIGFR